MRDTFHGFELYERADGIIHKLPGWSFMDWVPSGEWRGGWAPGSRDGGANAEMNLFYLAALQGAAKIEDAFGNRHLAAHWREKAAYPHPSGKMIEVDLIFEAGKARGRITTPVVGEFVFGGVARSLVPGANEI